MILRNLRSVQESKGIIGQIGLCVSQWLSIYLDKHLFTWYWKSNAAEKRHLSLGTKTGMKNKVSIGAMLIGVFLIRILWYFRWQVRSWQFTSPPIAFYDYSSLQMYSLMMSRFSQMILFLLGIKLKLTPSALKTINL